MNLTELLSLAVFAIFVENLVLVHFLGVNPFLESSGRLGGALGMGAVTTFLMGLTGLCAWAVNTYLLIPFGLDGFLQPVAFLLIIAVLAQLTDLLLKKLIPALYAALGIRLPLLITNCALLGTALLHTREGYGALQSAACGVFGGLGFTLVLLLFAGVRERLQFAECPKAFEGVPIALVSAGLLAMAFMGFSGLSLN